jgi:drug/metabolite transporter (DMT)-like permease
VVFAAVAAVLFGTAFFVLGRVVAPRLGSLVPALLSRCIGPALLLLLARALSVSSAPPPREHRFGALATGALASVATVATGLGSRGDDAAITAVLGSLSVVVTVLIGLVLLKERLAPHQWAGVLLALAGIPLLA